MSDVHVVGAGPAGCFAAKRACEHGAKVLVSEEHAKIGEPVQCSGLVSKRGLDSLGIDCSDAIVNELSGADIFTLNDCMHVKANGTKAMLLDRKKFDEICASEAENAGARIESGKRVKKSDLSARDAIVVGADGAYSSVAEFFGFPRISKWAVCYQAFFEKAEIEDKKRVSIFLSKESFPGFFGWIIPESEEACRVGFGMRSGCTGGNVKKRFEEFLKREQAKQVLRNAKMAGFNGGAIPLEVRKETARSNVLLAGDAAGQVKATTGGGIFFGCSCAEIAGELAAKKKAAEYEKTWRCKFEKDLFLHAQIRSFLDSLDDSGIDSYIRLAKMFGIEKFLSEHGEMDLLGGTLEKLSGSPFASLVKGLSILG